MQTLYAVAALAAALLVAPAIAQDSAAPRSQAVAHADLDLRDARDVAKLDLRIVRAARTVCGEASSLDPVGQRQARACVANAVARSGDARAAVVGSARDVMVAKR